MLWLSGKGGLGVGMFSGTNDTDNNKIKLYSNRSLNLKSIIVVCKDVPE